MKKPGIAVLALLAMIAAVAFKGNEMLSIGEKAPLADVQMEDVSGKNFSLNDLKMENGLLVIFSCNTCPFVLGWEDTYPKLGNLAKENEIGMILLNSNEGKRKDDDSMIAMQKRYEEGNYNTPYVIDKDHKLADAFGAKATPHVYLFNAEMELVYRGAINDKYENKEAKASKHYLENALKQLAKGGKIDPAVTKERGCSIKRLKV